MENKDLVKALLVAGILVLGYGVYNYINNRKDDTTLNNTTPPTNPIGTLHPIRGIEIPIYENTPTSLNGGAISRATGNANNFYKK